jgi:hypothetical protein
MMTETEAMDSLDAYGHLTYTLGFSDESNEDVSEDSDRGDWLACFDFCVFTEDGKTKVAYHAVVNSDSGGFIDTTEKGIVDASEAPFGLPENYLDAGFEQGVVWTDREYKDAVACIDRWKRDLQAAIDDEKAEQASADFERSLLKDAFRDNLRACIDNAIENDGLTADEVNEILRQEV